MHFSLVKMNPDGASPSHGFDDAIFPLYYALSSLGYETEILFNRCNPGSRNIVFGSCIAPRRIGRALPKGSIVFNLEQINMTSKWCNADYMAHLRDYAVWDYSAGNVAALQAQGIGNVTHVPLGYVPEMRRLRNDFPSGADVLFYGLVNDRRHEQIQLLLRAGLRVLVSQEAFGDVRDRLLANTKLLLNVHQFLPARLETVRLGYVWANAIPVVSEYRSDTEIPDHLREACLFAEYEALPEAVLRLVRDDSALRLQGERGFNAFASRPMAADLQKIVGKRGVPSGGGRGLAPCCAKPYYLRAVHEWLITKDMP